MVSKVYVTMCKVKSMTTQSHVTRERADAPRWAPDSLSTFFSLYGKKPIVQFFLSPELYGKALSSKTSHIAKCILRYALYTLYRQ